MDIPGPVIKGSHTLPWQSNRISPRRRTGASRNLREILRLLRPLCAGALALTFTPPFVLSVEGD
jgi:hypothetical protein